jgi:two-component system phosphate regulon sensor histidine kinase PhoR
MADTSPQRLAVLASLADALPDPFIVLDRRGVVLHANPPARREWPTLQPGSLMSVALRNPFLLGAIETARRDGTAQTVKLHQTVPNETWHRAHVAPLAGSEGDIAVTLHDLSEQEQLERLRADFIANASHELRTPLTSLAGFIDTLLGPAAQDGEARARFLGIMRQQAARMSRLIDDLLSLSRIEMRQHLLPTGSVDIVPLLREVADGLQMQAADAGVEIVIDADRDATVPGDRNELYEVFENLIENAIKYGASGKRVDVKVGQGRAGYECAVTVTDYGPGIESRHVPRLTERFYRADADSSRRKMGTGLGLAIVKHIVHRHRGALFIRSAPGEGMRVEVQLAR